jgi:hypothetical protein
MDSSLRKPGMVRQIFFALVFSLYLFLGGGKRGNSLHESALAYTAVSQREAIRISRQLIPDGGKPGNICGPLSLQILKDGGLISPNVDIKDFWFLRPWEKWVRENIVDRIFPPDDWLYYRTAIPLDEFNFSAFPLQEGDFLFFYYGYSCGGTFSHMLVVTKAENGKAYSVTNYLTTKGWRIGEVLLYDLNNQSTFTFFDQLTDSANTNTIGTTGLCGFSLWRKGGDFVLPCIGSICPY